jgi:hypothetical protein
MRGRSSPEAHGQLPLLLVPKTRRRRYVPTYDHYPPEQIRRSHELLDQLHARLRGLKPYEGLCPGCGKLIWHKAPHCNRRSCSAAYPIWKRDQRRVVREALTAYGGLLVMTAITLPGTPEHSRRSHAIRWADQTQARAHPKDLYRANTRFGKRKRWLLRQARNHARKTLRAAGIDTRKLPPVLVSNVEVQRRGALHAHLALAYTTPTEVAFARAFIDGLKLWAPRCGLGFVQGWQAAERKTILSADRAAAYMTKYLTSKHPPEFLRVVHGPVVRVSATLSRRSGCTMQLLRKARRLWSARDGRCDYPDWDWKTAIRAGFLLDRGSLPHAPRAP